MVSYYRYELGLIPALTPFLPLHLKYKLYSYHAQ